MVIRSTALILDDSIAAINEEQDMIMAEQAILSNLKMLEGLIKGDPDNRKLLLLASQGFSSYAFGFAEESDPERAKIFYNRGRDYGLRILKKDKYFSEALEKGAEGFKDSLKGFGRDDIPALFWTGYSWSGWINLNKDSPEAIADIVKVEYLMNRVLKLIEQLLQDKGIIPGDGISLQELKEYLSTHPKKRDRILTYNEGYYYWGSHLFLGAYYAGRPGMLGGDTEKGRSHFEICIEITGGRFLMTYVLYARFYAVQVQDRGLFEELLNKVIDTPGSVVPEQRLANEIAKTKARRLLERVEDFF
ncbi:MAG: TRAP transporter TatT component family protein [Nitrospinota bacterium]